MIKKIRIIQKNVHYRKLNIRSGNNSTYDVSDYETFKELFRDLYYKKMTIDDAEHKQDEFDSMLAVLSNYIPKAQKYIEGKNKLLDNAKNFYEGREKINEGFKNGIFPLNYDDEFEEARQEEEKNIRNKNGLIDYNKFMRLIYLKERDISDELVRKHFLV